MDGLNTVLPIGTRKIDAFRTLTTESLAVFMPFKVQEIQDKGGIYYGENAVSHNLIMVNKANLMNQSAILLGVPGSGKSFSAKQLMMFLMLNTDDDTKGDLIELPVMLAAFYGLRRSEVLGLKWDAIDFEKKTITIKHTVTQTTLDGKSVIIEKDRTKTKSSYRTLPLVKPFEDALLRKKAEQAENRRLCGKKYLGVKDIAYNQPKNLPYPTENPWG